MMPGILNERLATAHLKLTASRMGSPRHFRLFLQFPVMTIRGKTEQNAYF